MGRSTMRILLLRRKTRGFCKLPCATPSNNIFQFVLGERCALHTSPSLIEAGSAPYKAWGRREDEPLYKTISLG